MSEQYLYCVQFVLDRELTAREVVAIRDVHGAITVTNVTVHPFSGGDWPPIEEFAVARGYVCAVVHGASSVEAAGKLGDAVRLVLGEGHLRETKIYRVCRYTES